MPNYLKLLQEAIEQKQWEECRAVVHVLRGLLRQLGAVRLHAIYVELNTHLKNGGQMNEAAYQKIVHENQTLEQQIQTWMRKNV